MFILLMSGNGWSPRRDTFSLGRVLEYTEDRIKQLFMPNDVLDCGAITGIPALFASETRYDNTQGPARVGRLTRVRLVGTELDFDYVLDDGIAPIPNSVLEDLSGFLEIRPYEFSRTHWAIKDADLFEVLLKAELGKGLTLEPTVFDLGNGPADPNLVAVMMPYDAGFQPVYNALESAVTAIGMRCLRAKDMWENDHIIQDIVSLICRASVVICDLSGRNANVFYEMGIAHTLGKDVIMLAGSTHDVPFDVRHIRYIPYFPNTEGLNGLASEVTRRLTDLRSKPDTRRMRM